MIFFYVVYRMPSVAVKFYPALTRFTKTVQLQWYKMECKYICLNVLCSLNISWISLGRSYHLVWKVTQHENNSTMQRLKSQFFVSIFAWFIVEFMGKGSHLIFLPNCFTGIILKIVSARHLCCCLNNLKYMKNRSIVVRSVFYKCIWFAFLSLICAIDFYMLMFSL